MRAASRRGRRQGGETEQILDSSPALLPSAEADQGRWLQPTMCNAFDVKSTPHSVEICCTQAPPGAPHPVRTPPATGASFRPAPRRPRLMMEVCVFSVSCCVSQKHLLLVRFLRRVWVGAELVGWAPSWWAGAMELEAVALSDANASNPTANADTAATHAAHTDQLQVDGYVLRELHRHQLLRGRSC